MSGLAFLMTRNERRTLGSLLWRVQLRQSDKNNLLLKRAERGWVCSLTLTGDMCQRLRSADGHIQE